MAADRCAEAAAATGYSGASLRSWITHDLGRYLAATARAKQRFNRLFSIEIFSIFGASIGVESGVALLLPLALGDDVVPCLLCVELP